jgi:coenzyme F420-0:L-glutamate ligase/coenzyme F420-1:gamma-L-glutamate ligase
MENGIIIVETNHGLVCANAGIDESNVTKGFATLLPKDPDKSALNLQKQILEKTGKHIAVLISDTFGRPFRMGQTDCAIGVAGINSIVDYEGKKDTFGKTLRITAIAIVDELCSAAELVMGKTLRCPAAIIRNYKYDSSEGHLSSLLRPDSEDLFK